jgi:hypothetical protein
LPTCDDGPRRKLSSGKLQVTPPSPTIHIRSVDSVAHQTSGLNKFAEVVHRRNRIARRQGHQLAAACVEEWIGRHRERGDALLPGSFESYGNLGVGTHPQDPKSQFS